MAKISDVEIPSLLFDEQASAPTTPATGFWRVYAKSDGLYVVDDAGTETGPFDAVDAAAIAAAGAVMESDTTTAAMSFVIDEDDMASDSATKVPTQQSVKAYVDANAGGGSGISAGTSFPGSPATHDLFYRTDRDYLYFYDGTRWVTVQEYVTSWPMADAAINTGFTGSAANLGRLTVPYRGTYSIYVTRFQVQTLVLTTNNGSNYWTVKLNRADASDTDTQIGTTIDTSADTAATETDHFISPNVVVDSSARQLKLRVDKVSAPGGLYINGVLHYRLVG